MRANQQFRIHPKPDRPVLGRRFTHTYGDIDAGAYAAGAVVRQPATAGHQYGRNFRNLRNVGPRRADTTESIAPNHNNTFNKDVISLNSKLEEEVHIPDANLQVMDGQHIGRVLPLKKSMTRFGNSGSGIIIITRRKDGYFISSLESNSNITVNKEPLADKTINLSNNDILVIDNTSMQFFFEN